MNRPPSDLQSFYESWARGREASVLEQDYVRRADAWKWLELERLIRRHGSAPASILEFGCGTAEMLELAGKAFGGAALYGIDLSERMVAMAARRLPAARFAVGGLEALESFALPVDLVLAVDILEHLEDPVQAARALGQAGRQVALKIPLERRVIRLGLRRQLPGPEHHVAGHLHFWTLAESRQLLARAGLEILDELWADPPESIRYHAAAGGAEMSAAGGGGAARGGGACGGGAGGGGARAGGADLLGPLREAHHAFEVRLERWTCDRYPTLHRWIFGSNHFVIARRAG